MYLLDIVRLWVSQARVTSHFVAMFSGFPPTDGRSSGGNNSYTVNVFCVKICHLRVMKVKEIIFNGIVVD